MAPLFWSFGQTLLPGPEQSETSLWGELPYNPASGAGPDAVVRKNGSTDRSANCFSDFINAMS